jgi:hypothetical protein
MPPESFIINADKVLARFGEWPHFHDMEVVSVHMDRRGADAPWIEFVIFTWNYTGRIAPEGYYEQSKHSLIRFRCDRVTANQFDDFNHQNVLDGLEFRQEGESITVRLPSIYGVGGSMGCCRVSVVDVVPAGKDGQPVGEG